MAKWHGNVGFNNSTETSPGVWTNEIIVKEYFGDSYKTSRRLQSSGEVNDNVIISKEISIVADPYANDNFLSILYVEFMGAKWKISNIDVQRPRLILTLGDIYNG